MQLSQDSQVEEIKVFISSTFRDLNDQRSYLVNVLFPTLRRKLEMPIYEIDLRWGITDQEARSKNVVDICLKYLYKSRPYFIGILGDRYGSLADPSTTDISSETEGYFPQVQNHINQRRSITEIEIINGVLESPVPINGIFFLKKNIRKFPGETDEMFQKQCALHNRIKCQKVYPWYEFDADDYKSVFDVLLPFFEKSIGKKKEEYNSSNSSFADIMLKDNYQRLANYQSKFIDAPSIKPTLKSIKDYGEKLSSKIIVINGSHKVGRSVVMSQFPTVLGKSKSKKKEFPIFIYGDQVSRMPNFEDLKEYILKVSKQEISKITDSGNIFSAMLHGFKVGMKSKAKADTLKSDVVDMSLHKIWFVIDNFHYIRSHSEYAIQLLIQNITWVMRALSNLAQNEIEYQILAIASPNIQILKGLPTYKVEFERISPKNAILNRLLEQYSKHLDPRVLNQLLSSPISNYGGLLEMIFKFMVSYVKHEELEAFVGECCKITNTNQVYKLYIDKLEQLVGKESTKRIFATLIIFYTGLSREDLGHITGLNGFKLNEALLCVEPFFEEGGFKLRDWSVTGQIMSMLEIDEQYAKELVKDYVPYFGKDVKFVGTWEWFANNYQPMINPKHFYSLGSSRSSGPRYKTIEEEIDAKYMSAAMSTTQMNLQRALNKFKEEDPEGYAKASTFERFGIAEQKYLDQSQVLRPVSQYALMHLIEALLYSGDDEKLYQTMKRAGATNNLSKAIRYIDIWRILQSKGYKFPYKEIYRFQAYRRDRLKNIADALMLPPEEMKVE